MAKNTPNYEFEKPEQNDFYDVDVQNRNWDKAETALTEFDDSGSVDEIKSFPDFLKKFVTGNKLAVTMRNLKAGMQFVLHAGQIVNNCVTDNAGLPLSAAQGKALMDKYTQLYSDMQSHFVDMSNFTRSQLEAVWSGNKSIIGLVGWKGSFSPNKNTGIVLAGGSCAVLVSVTGEIYMQSSAQNVPEWEKKGIQYADISVAITADQWITSANGLKYFNHSGWNIPVNAIGVSANISSWSGTAGNVTCSIYNNSYIQFRCENAADWTGIVRVAYSKY